jgi:PPE-repeat protein
MAAPPEVHSALLSSGPGPGGLLAAAGSWSSLSAAYESVADELSGILAAVQAGAWEGPSAEEYVAAHVPYLMWLMQASADSAAAAVQHETAATAYTAALAAMPTLVQLAANHAVHAVLAATNFFGINTIPIALNEAEYVWMWIQAAVTMAQYELISGSAVVASPPQTGAPPQILKPIVSSDSSDTGGNTLQIVDNDAGNPYDLSWWINRITEPINTFERDILEFPSNPSGATTQLVSDLPGLVADEVGHAAEVYLAYFPEINALALTLPAVNPGFLAGLAGLSGLGWIQPDAVAVAAAPTPEPTSSAIAGSTPAVSTAAAPSPATSAPASAPAATPATAPASGAPPPPPLGVEGAAYPYLVGGPTAGASTGMSTGAQRKALVPDIAAAAAVAAAAAQQKKRARRRLRAGMRGHGDEFMDMNVEVEPDWSAPSGEELVASAVASDRGAGNLGFAGTAHRGTVAEAAGLTTLSGDEFGGGPSAPMVPGTWEPGQSEFGERGDGR